MKNYWTPAEKDILCTHYARETMEQLLDRLPGRNRRSINLQAWFLGLRKSPEILNRTRFKPGSRSARWPIENYPVGALRIHPSRGDLLIKLAEQAWVPMGRWVWETERGLIPAGLVVRFINGDRHDTRIENLRLGTKQEVAAENSPNNLPKPLAQLIQLRGALVRQINRKEKRESHADRPS